MEELKKLLSGVAPGLATALGSPLAGAAVGMIAKRLTGDENAPQDTVINAVKQAVNNYNTDPDIRIKLAELENEFRIVLHQEHTKALAIEEQGRDSARKRDVSLAALGRHNWRADGLALSAVIMNLILMYVVVQTELPEWAENAFLVIQGVWLKILSDIVHFEFGSSQGSKAKADELKGRR